MRVSFLTLVFIAILIPASWAIDDASLVFYLPFEEGNGDVTVDQISSIEGQLSEAAFVRHGSVSDSRLLVVAIVLRSFRKADRRAVP